ncbi:hypothetical protein FVB43_18455 [Erwinia rhapontici]|uniref:hypothetical protein n=1 Tax=Erwinia rhapontici TaxID=55212 RepID=UPI0014382ADF|nr:hypothetical protein [Erwinia rhapontici]NKG32014.1 hypothetical protein [Erwinia rhapontici]
MFKHYAPIFLVSMVAAPLALAANLRAVDVTTFDIAGVKTGMDYDESVKAITEHFHVPASSLNVDKHPGINAVTGNKQPQYVAYEKDGVKLLVHFEGRVPADAKRALVVSQVSYEMPYSTENKNAMARAAVEKYGAQSNAPYTPMVWCNSPGKMATMACGPDLEQPVLKLSGTSLQMNDPSWTNARIKLMDSKQARKPGF